MQKFEGLGRRWMLNISATCDLNRKHGFGIVMGAVRGYFQGLIHA